MIKAENLTKRFYDTVAVDHIHAEIHNGSVFGLIGTNGAGKSTFLRMAAGILKPDEGSVTVDDETVFENTKVKARCFYIPDEPYFLSNGTAEDMKVFYQGIYPKFDAARFDKLLKNFELESRRKVQTFSKGMKNSSLCCWAFAREPIICSATRRLTGWIRSCGRRSRVFLPMISRSGTSRRSSPPIICGSWKISATM